MQIIITPNDIIERCLWDMYKKYRLIGKSEEEIKEFVEKNEPFQLTEDEAYAIGMLKTIETDNLIHVFVNRMIEMLQIKSNIIKRTDDDGEYTESMLINKTTLTKELNNYMLKFPEYYVAPINYKNAIGDLQEYLDVIKEKVSLLETISVKNRDKIFVYYNSLEVKKLLKY